MKEGLAAAAVRSMGLESQILNCRSLLAEMAGPEASSWTRTIAVAEVGAAVAAAEGSWPGTRMEAAEAEVVEAA